MNLDLIRKACHALNIAEPISIEPDGTVWTGSDDDRQYHDMTAILQKADTIAKDLEKARTALLAKLHDLGLTETEISLLLGS